MGFGDLGWCFLHVTSTILVVEVKVWRFNIRDVLPCIQPLNP